MSLKRQLFLASLLMLLIPWAGLKFVLELDTALRQQALQQLQAQGERLAELAEDRLLGQLVVTEQNAVYARRVNTGDKPFVWPSYEDQQHQQPWQTSTKPFAPGQPRLRWQAAADDRYLYLQADVQNHRLTRFNPTNPDQPHNRFEIWLQAPAIDVDQAESAQKWQIKPDDRRATPSNQQNSWDYRVHANWRINTSSWQIEVQMPLPAHGSRLGFQVIQTGTDEPVTGTAATILPLLVYRYPALEQTLTRQLSSGQQTTLTEPAGWIIAEAARHGRTDTDFDHLSPSQILETLTLNVLRTLIRLYQPEPVPLAPTEHQLSTGTLPENGLVKHPDGSVWLATEHPLFGGRLLVLEQSLDQLLSVSGSALGTVLARSLLIILALTLVLLGYASWLSLRIARLQRLVNASVDDDGRILGPVPPARSRDELGQLQQHFGQMVDRLQSYNHYLESFSRRLSHELKTPVAVVRSSLENLSHCSSAQERQQYLERAASATDRLRRILHSMSEAARLEQSFDQADKEVFDLADVAREATTAYQQLDPSHRIHYQGPDTGCPLRGCPEMLVQMLDKLVDNARDFTAEGATIEISLQPLGDHYQLEVFNQGSRLPADAGVDIFGAFVSQRAGKAEGHLGQGLLIVRLIADYHGGRVEARNQHRSGIDGVSFRVIIPAQNPESRTTP